MLVSSFGLVVNRHYCQDQLKSIGYYVKAETCHTANMPASCPMHGSSSPEDKGCCENESDFVKADFEQIIQASDLVQDVHPQVFPIIRYNNDEALLAADGEALTYLNYRPPPLVYDLSIRFQIFRC